MAKSFAINMAPTNHGGMIPATQSRTSQEGNLFVRAGDGHMCPKCKCWSVVIKSHDHVIMDGKPVAYVGDKLSCGASIMPQQFHVVGDSGSPYSSAASSSTPVQDSFVPQTDEHGLKFQLKNQETGKPLAQQYFKLKGPDGTEIEGFTDKSGYTELIKTGTEAKEVDLTTFDLSKPMDGWN